jgi:hypothetical protein
MERSSPSGFFTDTHDLIRRTGSGETGMNLYVHRIIIIAIYSMEPRFRAPPRHSGQVIFLVIDPLPGCPLGGSGIHHARWNEWNNPVRFPGEMLNNQQNAGTGFLFPP